jgi:hypothetical protein
MIETYIGLLALLALSPMSRMPAVLAVRQLPTYLVCGARGRRQSRATPQQTKGGGLAGARGLPVLTSSTGARK